LGKRYPFFPLTRCPLEDSIPPFSVRGEVLSTLHEKDPFFTSWAFFLPPVRKALFFGSWGFPPYMSPLLVLVRAVSLFWTRPRFLSQAGVSPFPFESVPFWRTRASVVPFPGCPTWPYNPFFVLNKGSFFFFFFFFFPPLESVKSGPAVLSPFFPRDFDGGG